MKQPQLNEIPLPPAITAARLVITMTTGQWDQLLEAAYNHGWMLLELDHRERPRKAYRKEGVTV